MYGCGVKLLNNVYQQFSKTNGAISTKSLTPTVTDDNLLVTDARSKTKSLQEPSHEASIISTITFTYTLVIYTHWVPSTGATSPLST